VDRVKRVLRLLEESLTTGDETTFMELIEQVRITGFGQARCLIPRRAGTQWRKAYRRLLPMGLCSTFSGPGVFLVRSVLAVINTPLPQARVFFMPSRRAFPVWWEAMQN